MPKALRYRNSTQQFLEANLGSFLFIFSSSSSRLGLLNYCDPLKKFFQHLFQGVFLTEKGSHPYFEGLGNKLISTVVPVVVVPVVVVPVVMPVVEKKMFRSTQMEEKEKVLQFNLAENGIPPLNETERKRWNVDKKKFCKKSGCANKFWSGTVVLLSKALPRLVFASRPMQMNNSCRRRQLLNIVKLFLLK